MAYGTVSFSAGEQPSTSKWNQLGLNDASFNDGTGIQDNAIAARHLAANSVTPSKMTGSKLAGAQGGVVGSAPSLATDFKIQAFSQIINIVNGQGACTFPVDFPTGVITVVFMPGDTTAGIAAPVINGGGYTKSGFTFSTGNNYNGGYRLNGIAVGW